MKGSEKQIKWAEDIKKSCEAEYEKALKLDPKDGPETHRFYLGSLCKITGINYLKEIGEYTRQQPSFKEKMTMPKDERHKINQAKRDFISKLEKEIITKAKEIIDHEDDAKFWIEHR